MLTIDRLMDHPGYLPLLQDHLKRSMDRYGEMQQILRFLDSQEKWLLAFVIYRQWVESLAATGHGTVYMSGIWEEAQAIGGYSRNTVTAFVDGLVAYGYIRRVTHDKDRRFQELHFSEVIHRAFHFWYMNHAASLDRLDGGDRAARLESDPSLVLRLHPPMVTMLIRDNMWRGFPPDIAVFFRVKNGYLVLDYLMGRLQITEGEPSAYRVGIVHRSELMRLFHMGRSTIYRLFQSLENEGLVWSEETEEGPELWISRDFALRVCRWQAAKFSRIDRAFDIAGRYTKPEAADRLRQLLT